MILNKGISLKRGLLNQKGLLKGSGLLKKSGIPFSSDALFILNGTISGNEFVDTSGNGRNWTINNKDFSDDWTIGFPLKSAATISPPSGDAVLIAADINNFMYTGGVPNEISVVSFFSNVDYENKFFSREVAQRVGANGIEVYESRIVDITFYETVKSGGDLDKCNSYFEVPELNIAAKWIDGSVLVTGDGSFSNPWKTINEARLAASIGDTIYIKSGTYNEQLNASLDYWYVDKTLIYQGLGNCKVTSPDATHTLRVVNNSPVFNNLIIDGQDTTFYSVEFISSNSPTPIFNNCLFKGNTSQYLLNSANNSTAKFNECVFDSEGNRVVTYNNVEFINCYTNAKLENQEAVNNKFNYNKSVYSKYSDVNILITNAAGGGIFSFIGNEINTKGRGVWFQYATNNSTIIAENNNIIFTWDSYQNYSGGGIYVYDENWIPYLERNNIELVGENATDICYGIYLYKCTTPTVERNIFKTESKEKFSAFLMQALDTYVTGKVKFNYNSIYSNTTKGTDVAIGHETTFANRFDGSEVIGNYYRGYRYNHPAETDVTTHAFLLSGGINFDIKYNFIEQTKLALVVKTGIEDTYTEKGIHFNLFKNNATSIWIRGINGINVINNTVYYDDNVSALGFDNALNADENSANPGNYSENVIVKNLIVFSSINTPLKSAIWFDQHAADNGSEADYCIISDDTMNAYRFGVTTYATIAEAKAASKMLNSSNANPLLNSDLTPQASSPINIGVYLEDYKTGLDILTNFGNVETVPNVITKNQNALAVTIGAYIK